MAHKNLIIKYLKVKALAEQGVRGERDNAVAILKRLERENPALRAAALAFLQEDPPPVDTAPPGVWPKNGSWKQPRTWSATGNWETIFKYAHAAAYTAYEVAEAISDAQKGSTLAENISLTTRLSKKTGAVLMTFRLPQALYRDARRLNYAQKRALKERMHAALESELDRLFGD